MRRFGRPLALVGISRGDFLRGVPAGRYRVDRRGLGGRREFRSVDALCAASRHRANRHADDDHDGDLVIPGVRLRLRLDAGGPAYSNEVLSTLSYRYAFYNYAIGPAAAVAVVIRFFGLTATVLYVRIQQLERPNDSHPGTGHTSEANIAATGRNHGRGNPYRGPGLSLLSSLAASIH
jgi:hypothetical protein